MLGLIQIPMTFFHLIFFLFVIHSFSFAVDSISLNKAVGYTLENQKQIQIAILNIKHQAGVVQSAGGPFDPIINHNIFHSRSHDSEGGPPIVHFSTHSIQATSSATKETRLGTQFAVNALYRHYAKHSTAKEVSFMITQPLLRNFYDGLNRQTEIADEYELQAVQWDTLFTISNQVLTTVNNYWGVVAAEQTTQALEDSVRRLEKIALDVDHLVKGNELAPNERNQPAATLALIKQQAIQSQYTLYAAKQMLLLSMGIIQENFPPTFEEEIEVDIHQLPLKAIEQPISPDTYSALIQQAFAMRYDILASEVRQTEAYALLKGLKNQALPDCSLFGQYIRHNVHVKEFKAPCTSPDFSDIPFDLCRDTEWRIGLNFSVPIFNDNAEGMVKQQAAVFTQNILQTQLLKQTTIATVFDLCSFLTSTQGQIKEAQRAVDLYNLLFENERKKLIAGFGSVFEMLNFEVQRITALVSLIGLEQAFLQNLASLRNQTGTLIIVSDALGTIDFENVLDFPLMK